MDMNVLMPIMSSLLSFFLLASPAAAQFATSSPATTTIPVAAQTSTSQFSNYSNNSSDSGGGIGTGALVFGGLVLGGLALAFGGAAPAAVSTASNAKGLSFGGRVVAAIPCLSDLGPSYWVTIAPAPATKQPFYIWTPETLRGITPPGAPPLFPPITGPDVPPPTHPGQEILGIADAPFWCCLPGEVPTAPGLCAVPHPPWVLPGLPGQRMQFANQSLI